MIKTSNYIVVYTGAGISTAANIPDYRGKEGLLNKPRPMILLGLQEELLDFAMPTFSHLALQKMVEKGIVKYIVTSNHDNMHQKAGTSFNNMTDLFGNAYVEKCVRCKKNYHRKVIVPNIGRICDDKKCGGKLMKTGTRMGGITPEGPLKLAIEHSKKADLSIVFGNSLTVEPFCSLPRNAKKMVICNLQETPYDNEANLKINSKCDTVMSWINQEFQLKVESFIYRQSCLFKYRRENSGFILTLKSANKNEPITWIESFSISLGGQIIYFEKNRQKYFTSLPLTEEEVKLIVQYKKEYEKENFEQNIKLEGNEGRTFLNFEKIILCK